MDIKRYDQLVRNFHNDGLSQKESQRIADDLFGEMV